MNRGCIEVSTGHIGGTLLAASPAVGRPGTNVDTWSELELDLQLLQVDALRLGLVGFGRTEFVQAFLRRFTL